MKREYNLILFIGFCMLLLLASHHVTAQDTVHTTMRTITDGRWQQLTTDEAFGYRNEIENAKKQRQLPIERFFMNILRFFSSTPGRIIIWGLLFLLLGYAVYRIFFSEKTMLFRRRERSNTESDTLIPEDIHDADWEQLLQLAVKNGELRNAVRYSYMLLLQMLQRQDLIQYRSDKTNYDYLSDLTDTPYKQPFRQLSRQYEYTWYGNFPVAPATYEAYMQVFNNLKKQLGR